MVFEPFKPRPVFGFCMCPSSSLLYGWFRRRRVSSSLLFLSGAGETQTPFGGFGVPLVFLPPGQVLPHGSVHRAPHLPLGFAPAPVFFFHVVVVVVRWLFGGRSRFVRSLLVWRCVVFFLHAHVMLLQEIRGSQTIIWRPYYYYHHILGQSENPHPVAPQPLSGLHSPHPLPVERCNGQPRKGVGDRIGRQPYCHAVRY